MGIILAALGGVLLSFADAGKKALTRTAAPEVVVLGTVSFGLIIVGGYLLWTGLPFIDWEALWPSLLFCGSLSVAGELLFIYGVKDSDFSLAMPLMAFMPVFSSLIGYLLFREVPTAAGAGGAALVVAGAYLLQVKFPLHANLFLPLRAILSSRPSLLMLGGAFVGSVILVGQRYGVRHASPLTFFVLILAINWVVFTLVVLRKRSWLNVAALATRQRALFATTGITWGIGLGCVYASYTYTLAVYAGAVIQVQTLISITLGALLFKEQAFGQRLLAGLVMVAGVVAISLGG